MTVGSSYTTVTSRDEAGSFRRYRKRIDIESTTLIDDTEEPILFIPWGGESLAAGGANTIDDIVNGVPPYPQRCLMFNVGARPHADKRLVSAADIIDFVPAHEAFVQTRRHGSGNGETPGTSMMAYLTNAFDLDGAPRRTLAYMTHGLSGSKISDLLPGSVPYENALVSIERAVAIAAFYGRKVEVPFIPFTQGINDRGTCGRLQYQSLLEEIYKAYSDDVQNLTGQTTAPKFLIDQTSAPSDHSGRRNHPLMDVAAGQVLAAQDNRSIITVCPKYFFQNRYGYSDTVHLKGLSYALLGEYHAKAAKTLLDGSTWTGLRPKAITREGADITIEFHVPVEPLVIDTDALPYTTNYGFAFRDDSNSASIEAVSLSGLNRVAIKLTNPPHGENAFISYAYLSRERVTGRAAIWGNLRDSDTMPSRCLENLMLRNWCFTFRAWI